jgi:DNA-directed RNA polymerase specialized sigma24 family protein
MEQERRELVDRLSLVVAERATDKDFKGKALAIVRKKMTATVNNSEELPEIAEDAVSTSAIKVLEKLPHRSLLKLRRMAGTSEINAKTVIERYLKRCVVNYCNDRLRRWSLCDEKGRVGYAARGQLPVTMEKEYQQKVENWDAVGSTSFEMNKILVASYIERLEALKVSKEDMIYIEAYYSGQSYKEMADEHGGDPDKYRKRLKRVLEKLR